MNRVQAFAGRETARSQTASDQQHRSGGELGKGAACVAESFSLPSVGQAGDHQGRVLRFFHELIGSRSKQQRLGGNAVRVLDRERGAGKQPA